MKKKSDWLNIQCKKKLTPIQFFHCCIEDCRCLQGTVQVVQILTWMCNRKTDRQRSRCEESDIKGEWYVYKKYLFDCEWSWICLHQRLEENIGHDYDCWLGLNSINVLRTAFALVDPKSVKNTFKSSVCFYAFRIYEHKSCM